MADLLLSFDEGLVKNEAQGAGKGDSQNANKADKDILEQSGVSKIDGVPEHHYHDS